MMKCDIKYKAMLILFLAILFGGGLLHILMPDQALSYSERRTLHQFPPITASNVFDTGFMADFESYLLDQFPARETLRSIKAYAMRYAFMQSDNHDVYIGEGGHIFKHEYPLREDSVQKLANKLNALYEKHLKRANVYYAIIPDKAQYSSVATSHLKLDRDTYIARLRQSVDPALTYIPIEDCLDLESYYRTDLHWRQDMLFPVVNRLGAYMGYEIVENTQEAYDYAPFYGAYYGQSALLQTPDTLRYLKTPETNSARVQDVIDASLTDVYSVDRLGGMDSYDVFLGGATPLITVYNQNAKEERELILFRDSYASSLAPLLLPAYSKITLVDLRYLSSALLEEYIDFQNQDALFLYGEQLLNNSDMLK